MVLFQRLQVIFLAAILGCFAAPLRAVTVTLDYQFDTNDFFGAGNPDGAVAGAEARASLEAAASFFSGILTDTFSEIQTPAPFSSAMFSGMVTWQWSLDFSNPQTGLNVTLQDETIAADEYRIYVGARSLTGSTLGVGGPGGFGWSSAPTGSFTSTEIDQLNQITADFSDAVETRGESSGFSRWGGAVTFDSDASTNWHYDHVSQPTSGDSDFFSVAIHEIGHSLGLGASDDWDALVSGTSFTGVASVSEFGSNVPLDCDINGCGHWADGTSSVVLGTAMAQEAAMDPSLLQGTRKLFTSLDAAGLTDIGWSVVSPTFDPADYDGDGDVDGSDLATLENWFGINGNGDADGDGDTDGSDFLVWQRDFTGSLPFSAITSVPEPSTFMLCALASLFFVTRPQAAGCGRRTRPRL